MMTAIEWRSSADRTTGYAVATAHDGFNFLKVTQHTRQSFGWHCSESLSSPDERGSNWRSIAAGHAATLRDAKSACAKAYRAWKRATR